MRRRLHGSEQIAKFVRKHARLELTPVRQQLERWARFNANLTHGVVAPDMPTELTDREADMWNELIVIADLIGWDKDAREWAVELSKNVPPDPEIPVQILADV